MVDVPDISNVMMYLTSIDSQLVQICITWCTSLDCVKYYAAQYNASNGRWQKFVTLEVSPSSETNYVVAQWTEQPPLSKIIGNNIRFHHKTFISSFSFTNVKIRQNSKVGSLAFLTTRNSLSFSPSTPLLLREWVKIFPI